MTLRKYWGTNYNINGRGLVPIINNAIIHLKKNQKLGFAAKYIVVALHRVKKNERLVVDACGIQMIVIIMVIILRKLIKAYGKYIFF